MGHLLVAAFSRGTRVEPPCPLGEFEIGPKKIAAVDGVEGFNESLLRGLEHPSEIGAIERIHAWAGVEFGSIFHDRDVANCAFSIPSKMKIRGHIRKYVLRAAARDFLPDVFAHRPKDLIRIKRDERLMQVLIQLRDDLLSSRRVRARGLFDPEYVDELFARAAKPGCSDAIFYHLWTLLLIELWCRSFGGAEVRAYSDGESVVHASTLAANA
jgi:asparagine synthetase B (glutamine-hydrolysing)